MLLLHCSRREGWKGWGVDWAVCEVNRKRGSNVMCRPRRDMRCWLPTVGRHR